MSIPDNLAEAVNAVLARPGRTLLIAIGTLAGIATLVATLGVATTASAQISANFNAFTATQVTMTPDNAKATSLPADSLQRARRINGVVAAGRYWHAADTDSSYRPAWTSETSAQGTLFAADPGALEVIALHLVAGRPFTAADTVAGVPAILLSQAIAKQLDIQSVSPPQHVFIRDRPFLVMGIYDNARRQPETLLGTIIDANMFTATFGATAAQDAHVIVATRAGSAQTVADQLPVALRVDDPKALTAATTSSSATLRGSIDKAVQQLLLVLAVVAMIIGALSIANGTLVSAVERVPEIGLRRALGATRGDVATQFMFEGAVTGTVGGVLGYGVGIIAVVTLSKINNWTPTIDLGLISFSPLVGTVTGLAAAAIPAWRATSLPAAQALRR